MADDNSELKKIMLFCMLCRSPYPKHYKKVHSTKKIGDKEYSVWSWISSKEVHVCKTKVVERKDWE